MDNPKRKAEPSPPRPRRKRAAPSRGPTARRNMETDAARYLALWDRLETLVTAFLESFWREPEDEDLAPPPPLDHATAPEGESAPPEPRRGRSAGAASASRARPEEPSSRPGPSVAGFAGLYPPDGERPGRPGPTLKDLAAAIVCLRRIQDARFALDRKSTGEDANEQDGNAVDFIDLLGAVSETLKRSAPGAEDALDEGALRD